MRGAQRGEAYPVPRASAHRQEPKVLVHRQPARQAPLTGPDEVPVWQVALSWHHPHDPRSVHATHPVLVRHGSEGSTHCEGLAAQLLAIAGQAAVPSSGPASARERHWRVERHQPQSKRAVQSPHCVVERQGSFTSCGSAPTSRPPSLAPSTRSGTASVDGAVWPSRLASTCPSGSPPRNGMTSSCASTSMQRPVATSQRSLNAQDRPAHTRASSSLTVAA